jgi:kynurenine 3-monooxygenase
LLNELMMTEAERTGKVRIHFNERLESADLANRELKIVDELTHVSRGVPYERVFGTDGSASSLRASLGAHGDSEVRTDLLDYGYKEIVMHPREGGGDRPSHRMDPGYLHIWPRGSFMLIALPNPDGTFTCTLFLSFQSEPSFSALKTEGEVEAFFAKFFPDALELIPDVGAQFFSHPTGHMITVYADQWHHDGDVLILGDAAHAIVPFFGQGMNSGFEDCEKLDALLEKAGPGADFEAIFEEFFRDRKPNADAIARLALENFIEMRDRVADPRFLLQKQVEKLLHERFPARYIPRYVLVTFSRVPYRLALEAGIAQDRILSELCSGIERADQVDFARAEALIKEHLAPIFNTTATSNPTGRS